MDERTGSCVIVMMMGAVLMLFRLVRCDVPAAVIAGRRLLEAGVAIERAAFEILLQSGLRLFREITGIARQRELVAAAVALMGIPVGQQRRVMVMRPARHLSGAA